VCGKTACTVRWGAGGRDEPCFLRFFIPLAYPPDGKQYIVVAISGGAYSGEYLAFSLPN